MNPVRLIIEGAILSWVYSSAAASFGTRYLIIGFSVINHSLSWERLVGRLASRPYTCRKGFKYVYRRMAVRHVMLLLDEWQEEIVEGFDNSAPESST